ncbi:hypothetical protein ACOSQB_05970 [Tenacibaculum sp. MEBiC07804]
MDRINECADNSDHMGIWSSIQSFLISTSNISKIFWPKKKYENRGNHLRNLLQIPDNCDLKSRKFRNKLEHYDDFISEYFEDLTSYHYVDLVMNPSLSSTSLSLCHRGYNTFNNTLILKGEILDLNKILEKVILIRNKCLKIQSF